MSQFKKKKPFERRTDLPSPESIGIQCPHTERVKKSRGLCATCLRRYYNYACSLNRRSKNLSERKRREKVKHTQEWKDKNYEYKLKQRYNINLDQYDQMMILQGGVCYICLTPPVKRLELDHCHKTNKVRGLLCSRCNRGLAHYKDNPANFRRAIQYLERDFDGRNL